MYDNLDSKNYYEKVYNLAKTYEMSICEDMPVQDVGMGLAEEIIINGTKDNFNIMINYDYMRKYSSDGDTYESYMKIILGFFNEGILVNVDFYSGNNYDDIDVEASEKYIKRNLSILEFKDTVRHIQDNGIFRHANRWCNNSICCDLINNISKLTED